LTALLAVVLALLTLTAGCAPDEPRPSVSLLPLASPVSPPAEARAAPTGKGAPPAGTASRSARFAGVEAAWPLGRPGRLRFGTSERLALVTTPEVSWEMPVALRAGDRLRLSAAYLRHQGAPEGQAPAVSRGGLLLVAEDGSERTLGGVEAAPGDWIDAEIRVAEAGEGRLRLTSAAGPMAWAGVLLVRAEPVPPARPNLLLVSVDTLRADRLAAYGAERAVAPNLDRFAEGALVFQHSLSTSTWTLPSHASMFTGLLPDQHGLLALNDRLPADLPTVAQRLAEVGYHTVALTDGGFLHPRWGLAGGFDRWDWTEGDPWQTKDVRVVVERARAWLEANRFEPYFLFVHTYETHQPYVNREGFADPFLPAAGDPPERVNLFADLATDPPDPGEALLAAALYDGGVARMDHYLGGWLLELAEAGRLDDTAVILTSDHGEELAEHGDYEHANGKVFDENVRVPLLVRPLASATDPARGSVLTPATSLDLAPTLLAWAGAADPSLPGRPLPALAAEPDPARPILVHGTNSRPTLHERRYRLDRGSHSLVFDRVRSTLRSYDRQLDPGMSQPHLEATGEPGAAGPELGRSSATGSSTPYPSPEPAAAAGLARLQAILAWSVGSGQGDGERLAVALPPGAGTVVVREGSAVIPRGVWDGVVWRSINGNRSPLRPGLPALLTFDLRPGSQPRELYLVKGASGEGGAGVDGEAGVSSDALALRGARWSEEPGWNPIAGRLPGPGEIFRTAGRDGPATLELDDEARQELRALGYLR